MKSLASSKSRARVRARAGTGAGAQTYGQVWTCMDLYGLVWTKGHTCPYKSIIVHKLLIN